MKQNSRLQLKNKKGVIPLIRAPRIYSSQLNNKKLNMIERIRIQADKNFLFQINYPHLQINSEYTRKRIREKLHKSNIYIIPFIYEGLIIINSI